MVVQNKKMFYKYKNQSQIAKQTGFTLVEVIISVGIFAMVMTVSIGAVLAIVGANKKAQSMHNVINNLNLAIESMVRDMRTGYDYSCEGGTNCFNGDGGKYFSFKTKQVRVGETPTITYSFNENDYSIEKEINSEGPYRLTSKEIVIDNLRFFAKGIGTNDDLQPSVIVIIQGSAKIGGQESKFNLQTLVSQRQFDL